MLIPTGLQHAMVMTMGCALPFRRGRVRQVVLIGPDRLFLIASHDGTGTEVLLAIQPDDAVDMTGAAVACVGQQTFLVLRRGHSGNGPYLREAQLARGEGGRCLRQDLQRMPDTQLFTGSAEVDAAEPVQPVGAGAHALVTPGMTSVELGDQQQQATIRRLDVGGVAGQLVLERLVGQVRELIFCILLARGFGEWLFKLLVFQRDPVGFVLVGSIFMRS